MKLIIRHYKDGFGENDFYKVVKPRTWLSREKVLCFNPGYDSLNYHFTSNKIGIIFSSKYDTVIAIKGYLKQKKTEKDKLKRDDWVIVDEEIIETDDLEIS